jgi:hypothetical protein
MGRAWSLSPDRAARLGDTIIRLIRAGGPQTAAELCDENDGCALVASKQTVSRVLLGLLRAGRISRTTETRRRESLRPGTYRVSVYAVAKKGGED